MSGNLYPKLGTDPSRHVCDVCGNRDVDRVANSSLGAFSLGYCAVCWRLQIEPVGAVLAEVAMAANGDWSACADWYRGYPARAVHLGLLALHGCFRLCNAGTLVFCPKGDEA